MHRWDARLAHRCTAPINQSVAEVGIEQALREGIGANRWYVREFRKAVVTAHGEQRHGNVASDEEGLSVAPDDPRRLPP